MSGPRAARSRLAGGLVLVLLALGVALLGGCGVGGSARSASSGSASSGTAAPSPARTPDSALARIRESSLPPQGRTTLERIRSQGPFPHARDGITFENREGILPRRGHRYYGEYTVPTPGASDRGARRIIDGRGGDRYYTDDHYASFRQIEEGQ